MKFEEFIKKAKSIHKDKYDYSSIYYDEEAKKLAIICPVHGEFFQTEYYHLKGFGCKRCGDLNRGRKQAAKFSKTFIERANATHNSSYDYSKVDYKNSSTKIEIICLSHGSFFQRPNNHLLGIGCPKCGSENSANKQRMPLEDFLSKAYTIHGNYYDYTNVNYVSTHQHVTIVCQVHGPFNQAPSGHLAGRGCVYCAAKINADQQRGSSQEFIERGIKVHGKTYDYSKINYVNNNSPVEIICSEHGSFFQTLNHHVLRKQGCPSCANRDMDTAKFIKRAREIHGEKYYYNSSIYTRAKNKIEITCLVHGNFKQSADSHLAGHGCELCTDLINSKGSKKVESWLNKNNFKYEREKTFDGLVSKKGKKKFRFDFYLNNYKTLIEYDGEQHFRAVSHWGGEKALKQTQENDKIKTSWALMNGFKLLRLSYLQFDDIDDILNCEFLNIENMQSQNELGFK